jgi:phosphoribosylformylglycinamidine synthase subunit PurS
MRVTVEITRRPEISDPQGTTIARALSDLGHRGIIGVRVDRLIHLDVADDSPEQVIPRVEEMCRQLLANPVLEDYRIRIEQ